MMCHVWTPNRIMNYCNLHSCFCALVGIYLFLYGFFWTSYDARRLSNNYTYYQSRSIPSLVDKLVVVVIDALRYDFVIGNNASHNLPFIYSSIIHNDACVFQCRVHLPTVTMPRIKAMTIGSISNFLDIALNFGSTRVHDDNILMQMVQNKIKIVFYGDDTWIRLFPEIFYRQEGTNSFFVSDFYEVDENVTRNVNKEITKNDWDVMILHYLGLDHIGHLEGPRSIKIPLKLQEMDAVVEKLNTYLLEWKKKTNNTYLLMICADHGMKDSGGHGGSTMAEVLVPLVTLGVPCSVEGEVSQVDIAVTISMLLGLSIPRQSVGKIINGLLVALPKPLKMQAYRNNARHLIESYTNVIGSLKSDDQYLFEEAEKLRNKDPEKASRIYQFLINNFSSQLIDALSNFDVFCLYVAISLVLQAFCLPVATCTPNSDIFIPTLLLSLILFSFLYAVCFILNYKSIVFTFLGSTTIFFCSITLIISFNSVLILNARNGILRSFINSFIILRQDLTLTFIMLGSVLQILSTVSTSFIEEEHMTWYFLWTSFLTLMFVRYWSKDTIKSLVTLLIIQRILRKMNQTGDKWASLPDISDWFQEKQREYYLSVFLIFGLTWTYLTLQRINNIPVKRKTKFSMLDMILSTDKYMDAFCMIAVYWYRSAVGEVIPASEHLLSNRGISEFRIHSYLLTISMIIKLAKIGYCRRQMLGLRIVVFLINLWVLFTAILMRPHNVILFGSLIITSQELQLLLKLESNILIKTVISHHWLAHIYFFYQGNSNSLASIDVAPGYTGQTEYNQIVIGTLIVMCTYAMPVLSYLLMLREVLLIRYDDHKNWILKRSAAQTSANILLMLTNFYIVFYLIIVTVQRYHLFIWSVFSPKLLYLSAYSLLMYPVILALQLCLDMPKI